MPEPIMEPMTSMVALVRPRPLTSSLSDGLDVPVVAAAGVGRWCRCSVPSYVRFTVAPLPGRLARARQLNGLYPNMRKNSSADLRGSRTKSDMTATESAPASITERHWRG